MGSFRGFERAFLLVSYWPASCFLSSKADCGSDIKNWLNFDGEINQTLFSRKMAGVYFLVRICRQPALNHKHMLCQKMVCYHANEMSESLCAPSSQGFELTATGTRGTDACNTDACNINIQMSAEQTGEIFIWFQFSSQRSRQNFRFVCYLCHSLTFFFELRKFFWNYQSFVRISVFLD